MKKLFILTIVALVILLEATHLHSAFYIPQWNIINTSDSDVQFVYDYKQHEISARTEGQIFLAHDACITKLKDQEIKPVCTIHNGDAIVIKKNADGIFDLERINRFDYKKISEARTHLNAPNTIKMIPKKR